MQVIAQALNTRNPQIQNP